jgi:hypothetical protein
MNKAKAKFDLAVTVRCKLTGFTGYVDNRAEYLFGMPRYCVQPVSTEENKIIDSYMFDESTLELVDSTQKVIPIPQGKKLISLGQIVKDAVKGVECAVLGRAEYVNGCCRIYISPINDYKIDDYWIPEQQAIPVNTIGGKPKFLKISSDVEEDITKPETKKYSGGPVPSSKY